MSDPFAIDEQPILVPEGVASLDIRESWTGLLLRCAALEKQLSSERQQAIVAHRALLVGLLDVMDALDRILLAPRKDEAEQSALDRQSRSLQTTRRLLTQRLASIGVKRMELMGTVADPALADIEDAEVHDQLPDETVVREIVTGYWWHSEVLRRARVLISQRA